MRAIEHTTAPNNHIHHIHVCVYGQWYLVVGKWLPG
jgi:hypothetical protein